MCSSGRSKAKAKPKPKAAAAGVKEETPKTDDELRIALGTLSCCFHGIPFNFLLDNAQLSR